MLQQIAIYLNESGKDNVVKGHSLMILSRCIHQLNFVGTVCKFCGNEIWNFGYEYIISFLCARQIKLCIITSKLARYNYVHYPDLLPTVIFN